MVSGSGVTEKGGDEEAVLHISSLVGVQEMSSGDRTGKHMKKTGDRFAMTAGGPFVQIP